MSAKIQKLGHDGDCFYCGVDGKTFSIGEMADEIEVALGHHFYLTPSEPSAYQYMMIKELDYDWEREGYRVADVIADCAGILSESADDIRSVLAERHYDLELAQMGEKNPFDVDAQYAEKEVDDAESQAGWLRFKESIKTEGRYFNRSAEATLSSIFEGLSEHRTTDSRPIIIDAGPSMQLATVYRARVFQSSGKLEDALKRPDKEIGPPPPRSAAAGRMNAHGIPVFYGATDPLIALAEVRPPVGSRVIVGRFELIRVVRLLDIEALRSVDVEGSIFDRDYIRRLERAKFLGRLSKEITQPVMPDDEPFGYLATQAIADFLATQASLTLDGILYPSVQGTEARLNVVLFHKASRLEALDIPKGTEISAALTFATDEGAESDYWVWEEVPAEEIPFASKPAVGSLLPESIDSFVAEEYDAREATLRLDVSSLVVHHVKGVTFETKPHSVTRRRIEKQFYDF